MKEFNVVSSFQKKCFKNSFPIKRYEQYKFCYFYRWPPHFEDLDLDANDDVGYGL